MSPRQHGFAIVMALGVVAVAVLTATTLMVSQSTWARQSELVEAHDQSKAIAVAAVNWARALLAADARNSSTDHLGEPWAVKIPAVNLEEARVSGAITDEQGRFNLNNLVADGRVDLVQYGIYRRLLSVVGLRAALADALVDWLDRDQVAHAGNGSERDYYVAQESAYVPADGPLTEIAELRFVPGYDAATRQRLLSFITVLPRPTPVNVNTASTEVLQAIVVGSDSDSAREIILDRERAYFRDRADFLRRLPKGASAAVEAVSVSSDYFTVAARVAYRDAMVEATALLERLERKRPDIVWRKIL